LATVSWTMLTGMRKLLVLALLIFALPALSAVYKWIGPDGSVHYSDQPQPGAEKLNLPEPTIYSPRTTQSTPGTGTTTEVKGFRYSQLQVTKPKGNETIRSNTGEVEVLLSVVPTLVPGHKFRVYLDGMEVSSGTTSTQLILENVDRGTHIVWAVIVDQLSRERISSAKIQFHLRREVDFDQDHIAPPEKNEEAFKPDFPEVEQKEDDGDYPANPEDPNQFPEGPQGDNLYPDTTGGAGQYPGVPPNNNGFTPSYTPNFKQAQ
jgi:hypothetical protein